MIVGFSFNKKKDVENIWKAANSKSLLANFSKSLDPRLLAYIAESGSFEEAAEEIEKFNKKAYESEIMPILFLKRCRL